MIRGTDPSRESSDLLCASRIWGRHHGQRAMPDIASALCAVMLADGSVSFRSRTTKAHARAEDPRLRGLIELRATTRLTQRCPRRD